MHIHTNILPATNLAVQAKIDTPALVTREYGRRFRPLLEDIIKHMADDMIVVLDFVGIELMDASFADEVFGTIAAARARRKMLGGRLVLRSLDETSLENLHLALLSRPQIESGLRNCAALVMKSSERLELVGKVEGHVAQTFEMLQGRKQLTARELADELKLDIGAASTRLKVLHDLGLAVRIELRDEQGKLFSYQLPV